MIPAPFDYVRASTVDEAVAALAEHGEEAKVLAGGHSLLPLMKLRLAFPTALVDIGRVAELKGVTDGGDHLVIGAGTTHHEVALDPLVREHCPVVSTTARHIGDAQVRHRGTFGGGIAHGDCAGDLPAVMLALEADMLVRGPSGERTIPASEFFVDYLQTALAPDEVLVAARVPKLPGWGYRYEKFTRVAQGWAVVGSCALVRLENGVVGEARVGLTHMDAVPRRAEACEQALRGRGPEAIAEAAEHAAEGTNPPEDTNADGEFRRHLARVLTRRALEGAIAG